MMYGSDVQPRKKLGLLIGALQRKENSEISMEVGGWVQVSQNFFFVENRPKPVLIFWSSIPCAFCLYIHC